MAKRDILRAAKRKGLDIEQITWAWEPTPGEAVPCWSITIIAESSDLFYTEACLYQFMNTEEAIEWIESLELYLPNEEEPLAAASQESAPAEPYSDCHPMVG